jgi:hypothetical protein
MSVVTSVIVAGGFGCDPENPACRKVIDAINIYLTGYDEEGGFQRKHQPLKPVGNLGDGEKGFEADLWVGAFNYLRVDEFVGIYREAVARYRSRGFPPQLFIKEDRELEKGFVEIPSEAPKPPPPLVREVEFVECDRDVKEGDKCTLRKGHEGMCLVRKIHKAPTPKTLPYVKPTFVLHTVYDAVHVDDRFYVVSSDPTKTIRGAGLPDGDAPLGRLDPKNWQASIDRAKKVAALRLGIPADEIETAKYLRR